MRLEDELNVEGVYVGVLSIFAIIRPVSDVAREARSKHIDPLGYQAATHVLP